jgi:hypothetical protein
VAATVDTVAAVSAVLEIQAAGVVAGGMQEGCCRTDYVKRRLVAAALHNAAAAAAVVVGTPAETVGSADHAFPAVAGTVLLGTTDAHPGCTTGARPVAQTALALTADHDTECDFPETEVVGETLDTEFVLDIPVA